MAALIQAATSGQTNEGSLREEAHLRNPEYGRCLSDLGWDSPRRGLSHPTFPTWGDPIGMTLDHVFASPEFSVHSYELGDGGGSDHRSLKATVSLPPVRLGDD